MVKQFPETLGLIFIVTEIKLILMAVKEIFQDEFKY